MTRPEFPVGITERGAGTMGSRIRKTCVAVLGVLALTVAMVAPTGAAIDSATVLPTPSTAADQSNFLEGVSCVSASFCVAVGSREPGAATQTLALAWNGSAWTIQSTPNAGTDQTNILYDVSCVSASFCVAVGRYYSAPADQTLAMVWDGSVWAVQSTPNVGVNLDNRLEDVSCVSPTFCVAVGNAYNGLSTETVAMVWNGSNWTVQTTPNAYPTNDNYLDGVSCLSPSFCVATGAADNGTNYETLAMVWDGSTWVIQTTPNIGTGQSNRIDGVSCVSPSFCVAAGDFREAGQYRTMAMVWDGSTWALQTTPNVGALSNEIDGISCASTTLCVMVGYYDDGTAQATVAYVWDGAAWSHQSTPNVAATDDDHLNAVDCVSEGRCVAVGDAEDGSVWRTLAMALTGPEPVPTPTFTG